MNETAGDPPRASSLDEAERHWRHRRGLLLVFCGLGAILLTALGVWGGSVWLNRTKAISFCVTASGPDRKFAEKLALLLASSDSALRLAIVTPDDPIAAFARRECDLAVVRGDGKLPGWARSIANLEKEILLLVARKGVKLEKASAFKGQEIVVTGGSPQNLALLRALLDADEISAQDRHIVAGGGPEKLELHVRPGSRTLIFAVAPLSKLVQGNLLNGLEHRQPIELLDVPDAKALAQKIRGLSEETIESGLFSEAPELPTDDLSTASLREVLVTRSQLADATVAEIAKLIFENKADVAIDGEFATAVEPPDTDKDAEIIAHPGAVQYVNDDEKTFFDRYSDILYLSMPVASVIGSLFLWLYTRLTKVSPLPARELVDEVLLTAAKIRAAQSLEQLDLAERELDDILHQILRDLKNRTVSPEGLDIFRLAYEQAREWTRARRTLLSQDRP